MSGSERKSNHESSHMCILRRSKVSAARNMKACRKFQQNPLHLANSNKIISPHSLHKKCSQHVRNILMLEYGLAAEMPPGILWRSRDRIKTNTEFPSCHWVPHASELRSDNKDVRHLHSKKSTKENSSIPNFKGVCYKVDSLTLQNCTKCRPKNLPIPGGFQPKTCVT